MSVPMWRIALGPNGPRPTLVTYAILADTDVGADAADDRSAEHRQPMLTDIGGVAPPAFQQHRLPMSVGLLPMSVPIHAPLPSEHQ